MNFTSKFSKIFFAGNLLKIGFSNKEADFFKRSKLIVVDNTDFELALKFPNSLLDQ